MKKIAVPTEHAEQCALFQWRDLNVVRYPALAVMFAIPNGGARHIVTARKLKAEGVKAGVPDICLPVARGNYHCLFIEMKRRKGGEMSKDQKQWAAALSAQGNAVIRANGWEQAAQAITEYLTLSERIQQFDKISG